MIKLPSGAELLVTMAPFAESKALYQALLEEAKGLKLDAEAEVDVNLFKDIFCTSYSSKKIEAALAPCLARAAYNGVKIDKETFEPESAREDYMTVIFEVVKANCSPFLKALTQQYSQLLGLLKNGLA